MECKKNNELCIKASMIKRLIFAAFTATALCLNIEVPVLNPNILSLQSSPEFFWNLYLSLSEKTLLIVFVAVFMFFRYVDRKKVKSKYNILFIIVNIGIAGIWLMAEGFRINNSLQVLTSSYGQILKSFIYFVGISYGLYELTHFLFFVFEKNYKSNYRIKNSKWKKIKSIYNEHPFLVPFFVILLLWLPHLICAYPANMSVDSYDQLAQYFGTAKWNSNNPPINSLLMGSIISIGRVISGNFGLFLYIIIQAVVFDAVLSYMFCLMRTLKTPLWLKILSFFCCISVPYYVSYISVFLKDNYYSYSFLLFIIELIYMLIMGANYFKSIRHILLWAVSIIGIVLLRNNGKYILYPLIVLLIIVWCVKLLPNRKKIIDNRRIFTVIMLCMIIPITLANIIFSITVLHYDIKDGSIREVLSLPIQQTARYVKYYGDEVTEDEKSAISAVLDYEHLAENYDPRISDPVKSTFKYEPSSEELKNYFSVWFKQFFKHPTVYINATINQNYYIFYPLIPNDAVYAKGLYVRDDFPFQDSVIEALDLHTVQPFAKLRNIMHMIYKSLFFVPILNLLTHPATYTLLLLWLTLFALKKRLYKWLITALPLLLSAAVIFSPVVQLNPRYVFPIIYSMPIILAYYLYLVPTQKNN